MQSIQASIDLWDSAVQNIANTFMSSDFLKGAINGATTFVNLTETIISNLGAIPSLIGVISAAIGSKWNIFGSFIGGFGGSETVLPITQKTDLGALASGGNAGIKALIKEYNNLGKTISQTGLTQQAFIAKVAEGNQDLATYFNKVGKDGKASFEKYILSLTSTTIATNALKIATMALQGALFAVLGYIVQKGFEALDGWIHRNERLIEVGDEASKKITELNDKVRSQQEIVKVSGKRFAELAQGVDNLTGKNISLSDEEYQEFLNISNELAELFPELSYHYDENNNKIVQLNGSASEITGTLEGLLKVEQDLARQEILKNMDDVFKGAKASAETFNDEIKDLNIEAQQLNAKIEKARTQLDDTGTITLDDSEITRFKQNLNALGVLYQGFRENINNKYTISISGYDSLSEDVKEQILSGFANDLEDIEHEFDEIYEKKTNSISSVLSKGIAAWLYSDWDYANLNEGLQTNVQNLVNSLDWDALDFSNWSEAEIFLDKLVSGIGDNESDFNALFRLGTQFNNGEITWGEFQSKVSELLNIIDLLDFGDVSKNEELKKSFKVLFDIETDENGNVVNKTVSVIQKQIQDALKNKKATFTADDVIAQLDKNIIDEFQKTKINWDNILDSKSLDKTIQNIKDKARELSSVDFSIEYNRSDVEAATKGIKKIQTIFQDIYEKHEAGKTGSDLAVLLTDLEELKDASQKGEVAIQASEETWNELFTTLADGKHEYEDMTAALNKLLTEYVTNTIALENFDKAQADELSTQLQLAGVTKESADTVVKALSDRAEAVDYAVSKNYDFTSAIDSETFALLEEAEAAGYSSEELARYILQEQLADGLVIDTTESVNNLLKLAQAANVTAEELKRLATFQTDLGTWSAKLNQAIKEDNQSMIIIATEQIKGIKRSMYELGNEISLDDFEFTAPFKFDNNKLKSSSGGGGGSSKKEEDPWKEAYEKELAALNHLHEMELISDIQYYEEREKLNDKYFGDYVNSYKKAINEMADYQQQGNVDLFNRPLIKGSELIAAGWQDETNPIDPEEIATVYSSAFDILNSAGEKMIVHVTPILPDGTVMSPEQLEDYVYESLNGVNDVLAADTQGIVLKVDANVDVDEFGEVTEEAWKAADAWDVALHEVQEKVLLEGKDANEQAQKYDEEYMKNKEEIYKGFQSAYKSYVDDMTDYWKKSLDAGLINFSQYCDQMKGMLESLHNVGKIDDETYYTGLGNYYGTIVENYDKATNAAQRVIKKRIDALNKEKEAIEKNYEAQKDVLQAQIDDINDSIDGRNKQIKAINKQIDAINKEIESYQTEIDKLNEANEERQAALDMQKALYELSRAENQRKDYVYNSEQGFVYEANSQDIKNAQDEIAQLEHDRIVRDLEKTISTLENSIEVLEENIETLEDEIETLEGNIESLEDEMERLEKELDVLVEKYEEQINSLEEYSDSIGECANKWTEAQEDMVAASIWGSDWQNKILSEDRELVQKFESMYVEAQRNQAQANRDATNAIIEANNRRIESLKELQKAEEDAKQASNVSTLGSNVSVSNKTTPKDTSTKKETPTSTKPVKYAWYDPSAKRVVYEYGSGTKDAKPGYQEIAETGDEIIVDNNGNAFLAKGHQLHLFEGGEQVYSPSDTKELLNGKYIPIDSILPNYSSMLSKIMSYSISPTQSMGNNVLSTKQNVTPMKVDSSIHIDIGDIHITEVDNVTEVAKAIKNQLPNALLQELNRK